MVTMPRQRQIETAARSTTSASSRRKLKSNGQVLQSLMKTFTFDLAQGDDPRDDAGAAAIGAGGEAT
jgi:hypothetical protein